MLLCSAQHELEVVSSLILSAIVLVAFAAAAIVFLLVARLGARIASGETWFAALAQVVLAAMLLRGVYEAGLMLNRTPALVHAGFAGLAVVWGLLRRETALLGPPAPATITMHTIAWLAAVPVSGVLLSLIALGGGWELSPEIVGLAQMFAFTAVWLATRGLASESPVPSQPRARPCLTIFLCYRRDDSADVTGRIYDRLVERFGAEQVFKDVDSIPIGVDFRAYLAGQVGACDVVLAVIGRQWLAAGADGRPRLEAEQDFVRLELEAALERAVPVVPILVGGAEIPRAQDLPATLAALVYRQSQVVRGDPDFHRDVDRLLAGLERLAAARGAPS